MQGPKALGLPLLLSQAIGRELGLKWNSQDLNCCPYVGCRCMEGSDLVPPSPTLADGQRPRQEPPFHQGLRKLPDPYTSRNLWAHSRASSAPTWPGKGTPTHQGKMTPPQHFQESGGPLEQPLTQAKKGTPSPTPGHDWKKCLDAQPLQENGSPP